MREAELMCQESVLQVIRENMPVEKILRAYIDETVDEEIIEETIEKEVTELEKKKMEEELAETIENVDKKNEGITKSQDTVTIEKPDLEKAKIVASALSEESVVDPIASTKESKSSEHNIKLTIETPKSEETVLPIKNDVVNKLSFNDTDSVVNYDKKTGEMDKPSKVEAPKTLERLEKIAHEQNEKRKAEEAEYDEDDDDDDEKIKIFGDVDLNLDNMDVHNLDKKMKLEPDPILNDVEILG